MMGKALRAALLDLIYPPRCPCCARLCGEERLCAGCAQELQLLEHVLPGAGVCGMVVAAFLYEGPARSMILRYKRAGLRSIADSLAPYVAVAARRHLQVADYSCCVCVPGNTQSARERGFSASLMLAEQVARLLGVPLIPALRHTGEKPQKLLDRASRFVNAAESFRLADGSAIEGQRILLIDDLMTTGATLETCAALLHGAGATSVVAAVAAYDPPKRAGG